MAKIVTAKQIAKQILALPEEQQNVPLVFEYDDGNDSGVPVQVEINNVQFHEIGYPTTEPHIMLIDY